MSSVQKFAKADARVLSNFARDGFCDCKYCIGYCKESHDYALQKKLRAIAMRLVTRGYGPTPKQREAADD